MKNARYALPAWFTPPLSPTIVFAFLFLLSLNWPFALHAQTYTDLHDFNDYDGAFSFTSGIVAQGTDGNLYGTLPNGGINWGSCGTVYKITPSGTLTVIYSFDLSNCANPRSGLTLGTDGNFYGAGFNGAASGFGSIFKITPARTLTTLHSFTGSDGCNPEVPPILGKKGFYGVTGCSTAYTITSSGKFKMLPNPLPGLPINPLILGSDGNFYGATQSGGNLGYGTVFKLSPSGAVKVIYSFDKTHGAYPNAVVQGRDGNLYGTTNGGGSAPDPGGVVFKVSLKGSITVLQNFDYNGPNDGANPMAGLVAGTDGKFYGVTYAAYSGSAPNGNLFAITSGGTYSNLYDFDYTHGANELSTPMEDTNGIIYGETYQGGANDEGVFWSLDTGIAPFCSIVGYPAGSSGATVEILGQGFNSATSVMFGSGSASFNIVSDTYLTATVPDSGTTGPVTVTTSGGTLTSNQTFKVIPLITNFNPTSGGIGTPVTIMGSGLTGAKTVSFGGVKATFTVVSGTQINTTVPTGAVTGKIKVMTPGGSAMSKGIFTVN